MATETGPTHLTNRKLGVIILGASTYPHFPSTRRLDNASFERSAAAFRNLIADEGATVFGKPEILDLFDISDDPTSIIRQIKKFVGNDSALTDLLFYYCGHGDFLPDRTYYLTLNVTEPDNEAFTGLPLRQMRLALETQLMRKRVFLVLDCCFSGQAAKEWMATGIGHVIEEQIFQSFPKRGTALIAASARGGPAVAPEGESLTMFTGALISTISSGVAGEKRELSFRDIVDAARARISDRYGSAAVAPEIHAPQQDEGDITFTPFFANRAFVPPPETKAERENFEFAVADLDRPSLKTRVGAVETLEELLLSTQSAAFREEILNKLRIIQKADDFIKVREKCEEVLARWPEHPIVVPRVAPRIVNPPTPLPAPRRVVTYANGDRYDGEVRDGKKNGHGVLTLTTGDRYDGEYRDDKKNGRGVYTFANGERYDGEFRDDTYNGHGVYTWPGGRWYAGEWRNGEWSNGKAVSPARRLFELSGRLGSPARIRQTFAQFVAPRVAPPKVGPPTPPPGPGTPLGLSEGLGGSEGANKIDESNKPKTFALFPRSPTGAFLKYFILRALLTTAFFGEGGRQKRG